MNTHQPQKADLLGRLDVQQTGGFCAATVLTSWSGIDPTGSALLVFDVDVCWTQSVMRLYEIGSAPRKRSCLVIADHAVGRWQAARVLAPGQLSVQFYKTYSPPTQNPPALTWQEVSILQPEDHLVPSEWMMCGVEVTGVGFQCTAQNLTVQEQVRGQFDTLNSPDSR